MRLPTMTAGLFIAALAAFGCSSSNSTSNSDAAGGAGGTSAGAAGADGSVSAFTSVTPCTTADMYVSGQTMVTTNDTTLQYSPKCLKISKGTSVTIQGSATHPLSGTSEVGSSANNPIPMSQMTPQTVMFPNAGFFSYHCDVHFSLGMMGVIWVE